jgi:hypothetical protein
MVRGSDPPDLFRRNEMHNSHGPAIGKDTLKTSEDLLVDVEMIDEDNLDSGMEAEFAGQSSLTDGVSGRKSIYTMYENTSEMEIEIPRSAREDIPLRGMMPDHEGVGNPAPESINKGMYPHRRT